MSHDHDHPEPDFHKILDRVTLYPFGEVRVQALLHLGHGWAAAPAFGQPGVIGWWRAARLILIPDRFAGPDPTALIALALVAAAAILPAMLLRRVVA